MGSSKTVSIRLAESDRERFRAACELVEVDEPVVGRALLRAWTASVEKLGHWTFPVSVIPTKDLESMQADLQKLKGS